MAVYNDTPGKQQVKIKNELKTVDGLNRERNRQTCRLSMMIIRGKYNEWIMAKNLS